MARLVPCASTIWSCITLSHRKGGNAALCTELPVNAACQSLWHTHCDESQWDI